MSISGASGDHNQATSFAAGARGLTNLQPRGKRLPEILYADRQPALRSPAKASPAARLPASENSHVLCGLVRLTIVNPSGFGWISLKSSQIAFFANIGLPLNGWPVSCATLPPPG